MRFVEQKGPEIRTGNMVNDQDVRDPTSHSPQLT